MKEKIAITIDDKLLSRVDRAIDGDTIRNRSHAIEYYLNQAIGAKVEKALLVGGYKDFSCATQFHGKSLVEHQVELLKKHGVKKVFISLGTEEKEVQSLLGNGSAFGLAIRYHWQGRDYMGTPYIISLAKKFFEDDLFFVLYGDVTADIDVVDFAAYHEETGAIASIALTSIEDPVLYGAVKMKGEKIVGFVEQPKNKDGVSRVISAGIFCFSPGIFDYLPKEKTASLEKDVFPALVNEGKLAGYMFEGEWRNVRNQIYSAKKPKRS